MKFLIVAIISQTLLFSTNAFGEKKMEPIADFNLEKYLGKWYEIARLPASFEKNLINVTAGYSILKNGKVKVENTGINNKTFKKSTAIGKAKFAKNQDVGHLKVSFFGPFYADYIIMELDSDYRYALVASSFNYLWILSRTPDLNKDILDELIEKAKKNGFETGNLFFTPQGGS